MVVSFDEQERSARLSLRQTEILQKLANAVADLEDSLHDSDQV